METFVTSPSCIADHSWADVCNKYQFYLESLAFKFASKISEKRKSTIITFEDPSWQCVCVPACLITLVHFLVIKCTLSFARLPQQWRQSQCSHCTRCERIKKVSCKKSLFLQLKLPKVCITLAQCIFYSILWPIPFFLILLKNASGNKCRKRLKQLLKRWNMTQTKWNCAFLMSSLRKCFE